MNTICRTTCVVVVIAALAILLATRVTFADHCPDEVVIHGRSEHLLAGVDATRDHFEHVVKLFGQPASTHEFQDDSYPPGSGEAEYAWSLGEANLKVLTVYRHDSKGRKVEMVQAVMVQGPTGPSNLRTGRGVGLGASRTGVMAAYGSIYLNGTINGSAPAAKTIAFCFEDETVVEFTFGDAGTVTQVYLVPSAE